jgi:hypothetical protein
MSRQLSIVLVVLAGCAREPSAEPPAPAPEPSAPAVAATSQPPEPTAVQVPIAEDFRDEASRVVTSATYKAELAAIADQLEAETENAP